MPEIRVTLRPELRIAVQWTGSNLSEIVDHFAIWIPSGTVVDNEDGTLTVPSATTPVTMYTSDWAINDGVYTNALKVVGFSEVPGDNLVHYDVTDEG